MDVSRSAPQVAHYHADDMHGVVWQVLAVKAPPGIVVCDQPNETTFLTVAVAVGMQFGMVSALD